MNETKRRILEAALELYNTYGIGVVSQRKISDYLKISPGNLTYHFKKSDEIVEALYFQLVEHIDTAMAEIKNMNYDLKFLFMLLNLMVESFFKYRFIFLDFVHIMRGNEKINKHYEQLSLLRKQQFLDAVNHFIKMGLMRNEELQLEYEFLYERFHIIVDFWISSVEVKENGVKETHQERFKKVLIQTIFPYLTEKGKKEFLLNSDIR